jgi:VWFA-related protein
MRGALYLVTLLVVGVPMAGQSMSAASAIRSTSTLVIVPTLVTDSSGEPITTLSLSDFTLTDDGVVQKIHVDRPRQQPLALVILMQTGGGAAAQFERYRLGADLDFMVNYTGSKVALVTFDSRPEATWNFPSRGDGLVYAVTHPKPGDDGAAILDAINYAIDLLKEQPATLRRVILLLSQPQDVASNSTVSDVVRRLGESDTTVYSFILAARKGESASERHPSHSDPNLLIPNATSATELKNALRVQQNTAAEVAAITGGEHVQFKDLGGLEQGLSRLTNQISNAYTLSFRPSSKAPGLHSIKVLVAIKAAHLNVAARNSYWVDGSGNE